MPHDVFEGNTYRYLLTGIDVASRYKVVKLLMTKKSSVVAFVLGAIYKRGSNFKHSKVFQCDNGSEFKGEVTKLLGKHNVDIRRATTKYKHTDTTFKDAFDKELEILLLKPIDAQELQNPKKVSKIWVKNVDKILNKMNNTIADMIGMKPKDAIKPFYWTKYIQKKPYYLKIVYTDIDINLVNNTEIKKRTTDFIWSKNMYLLDRIAQEPGNCALYYLQDGTDRAFVREELMHVSEDTQVPLDWVSKWK